MEVLRYFKSQPREMIAEVLLRLLSYSEGLIRAEAALTWLMVERENDDEILERLQRDTHPSVVSRILDAATSTWCELSPGQKEKLATLLRSSHTEPETAAIAVLRLLSYFREADFEDSSTTALKPWELVGEVLAPALGRYPNSFRIIGHRLYEVFYTALEYLSAVPSAVVMDAWIDWLQNRVADGQLPDDYMLGAVTSLLRAQALSSEARRACIERLLATPSTGAVLVFVADLVSGWDALSDEERSIVRAHLLSVREDNFWMKAAALTRNNVPSEIEELILGKGKLSMPVAQLIEQLPSDLLVACVRLHRGEPQPLWYLGAHHGRSPIWPKVIRQIACMPEHLLFDECLLELIGFERHFGPHALSEVIRELDAPSRDRVFSLLLDWKTRVTGEWHQLEFDLLLELAASESVRGEMIGRMVEKAGQILERVEDAKAWSHRSDVHDALRGAFSLDFLIGDAERTVKALSSDDPDWSVADASERLVSMVEVGSLRLPSSHWEVTRYLRALDAEDDLFKKAEAVRNAAVQTYSALKLSDKSTPVTRLPNWIGPQ